MLDDTTSYWHRTAKPKLYPPLDKDLEVDTLIIGGGITGVTCAYALSQRGGSAALIEAGGLCDGTTGNTTGKLTVQHDLIYSRLMREQGERTAKTYLKAQAGAVEFVRRAVAKENIACDLADAETFLYAENEKEGEKVRREYEAARRVGINAELSRGEFLGGVNMTGFIGDAVFHPVKYVAALAEAAACGGVPIFCGTKAVRVEDGEPVEVVCESGVTIKAKWMLMATQYPIYDGLGFYFTRLYSKRSYAVALDVRDSWPDGSYKNTSEPARSLRSHLEGSRRILVVAGDGHHTARSDDMKKHYENLENFARVIAGEGEVLANWSAQDYETPDGIPYIGRISANSHIYIAAGFAKWGMSNGTLAGLMTADLITKSTSPYEWLFTPSRGDLKGSLGKFVPEVFGSVGELIKSKFEPAESIADMRPGEGRVINFGGNKAGAYLDEDGTVTIVDVACTHMTTHLNFDAAEKTWDCPAHGGRFATDGRLLEGPPKNPLRVLYKGPFDELVSAKRR